MSNGNERIAVLGLGRGGGRIAAELAALDTHAQLHVGVADTDSAALDAVPGVTRILLGEEWARHSGCGGDAVLGERAASASASALREYFADARLLIVLAGLGGGTGSGAGKVVARLARETATTAVFLVTLPFAFEGNWRTQEAEKYLAPLRELADTVIVVPNDLLFTALPADTPAAHAFELTDRLLAEGIAGLSLIASAQGLVTADFAGVRTLLKHKHATCTLAVGRNEDGTGWEGALEAFLQCPLIGGREALADADAAVITLVGNTSMSVGEIQACLNACQQCFPEDARLVVGAYAQEEAADRIQITGLICRYRETPPAKGGNAPAPATARTDRQAADAAPDARPVQGELPLQEQTAGAFTGVPPTLFEGHNLDIPTCQRRGIMLDVGD